MSCSHGSGSSDPQSIYQSGGCGHGGYTLDSRNPSTVQVGRHQGPRTRPSILHLCIAPYSNRMEGNNGCRGSSANSACRSRVESSILRNWTQTALKHAGRGAVDWANCSAARPPIVLDLGCGNGRFLIGSALSRPDHDHLATRHSARRHSLCPQTRQPARPEQPPLRRRRRHTSSRSLGRAALRQRDSLLSPATVLRRVAGPSTLDHARASWLWCIAAWCRAGCS